MWHQRRQLEEKLILKFPDMPCIKSVDKEKRRRSTGQQQGTRGASRPAVKPIVNRLSTADFVPTFGLHRISLVRASWRTFMQYFINALEGKREACFLGKLFCRRPVLTGPVPSPDSTGLQNAEHQNSDRWSKWERSINKSVAYLNKKCLSTSTALPL